LSAIAKLEISKRHEKHIITILNIFLFIISISPLFFRRLEND